MRRMLWAVAVGISALCVSGLAADRPNLSARIDTSIRFVIAAQQLTSDFALSGNSHAHLLPKFMAHAKRQGVPVYLVPLTPDTGDRLFGLTSCPFAGGSRVCVMLIDNHGSGNNQLSTLIHELSHLAHFNKNLKTVGEAEIFAETVTYLTLDGLGLNSRTESMSYLFFSATEATRRQVLEAHQDLIYAQADRFIKVGKG
jgi:hypothetical protein